MIFGILGHGGWALSLGFAQFVYSLREDGHRVMICTQPQGVDVIAQEVRKTPLREPTVLLGYSLGANSCAWVAKELGNAPERKIALVVGFDPTTHGAPLSDYPFGSHVEKVVCFRNVGSWPSSWLAGGAVYVGPQVQVIDVTTDHLWVQCSPYMRSTTRLLIADAMQSATVA